MRVLRVTDLQKTKSAVSFNGHDVMISRTGYTGEDGFEIVGNDQCIAEVWAAILEAGKPFGIKPCGLGGATPCARKFVTRFTVTSWTRTPRPSRPLSDFLWRSTKAIFIGRSVLAEQKGKWRFRKRCIAFKMTDNPRRRVPIIRFGRRARRLARWSAAHKALRLMSASAWATCPRNFPSQGR